MRGKIFFWLLTTFLLITVSVEAQQPARVPRIGYVSGTGKAADPGPYVEVLRQGLRALGYIDGKSFVIEYRGAEGKSELLPSLVHELVQLPVDVLVLPISSAIRAAKQATKTIPIVMITQVDPVAERLVDSLARPGGNITGLTTLQRDLSGKRLELLKDAVPKFARVGVLGDADEAMSAIGSKDYEIAARALKVELQLLKVRGTNRDIEKAFGDAIKGRVSGLITITSNRVFLKSKRIIELAIENRLPSMFEGRGWVEGGGLMSYSANDVDQFKRVAYYVDRILKGTKPADLPVEQPTKFEFVINLKTAQQIGLTMPQWVLMRADRVIR
jgi:ABC-type uncharacterized transport system substrate-binding protein